MIKNSLMTLSPICLLMFVTYHVILLHETNAYITKNQPPLPQLKQDCAKRIEEDAILAQTICQILSKSD